MNDMIDMARQSTAWPFEEARRIVARLSRTPKDEVIFSTGYGPSGLPHIGTFGEVARTSMVRHAFHVLTDGKIKTRLIAFSDDMDGLRKVPDNVPNQEMLTQHLGKPLTQVPDPFGTHPSFGAHNNARLRAFLDQFGFEYEFLSATECYTSGRFDVALRRVLENYEKVMAIMLPSLRAERAQSYSPFLPICPRTGQVLQVPVTSVDATAGTLSYSDPETGDAITLPVTGGHCKLQWKPDWAMRWLALGVDYEMAGKDLIDSVKLSGQICRAIGGQPPEGFNYELFLDEKGQKISKSKGNGLTIEDWLRYASPQSLSLFMYREPKAAKRLHFDVIPKNVDEYGQFLQAYPSQETKARLSNPVWHIHQGNPPEGSQIVSFSMLLNLVSASNAENEEVLWGFLHRYHKDVSAQANPDLAAMITAAIHYFHDFIQPYKVFRPATDQEKGALLALRAGLAKSSSDSDAEALQTLTYQIGKDHGFENLRDWFKALYQILLGQDQGPRFGSFIALYGRDNTLRLIDEALDRRN